MWTLLYGVELGQQPLSVLLIQLAKNQFIRRECGTFAGFLLRRLQKKIHSTSRLQHRNVAMRVAALKVMSYSDSLVCETDHVRGTAQHLHSTRHDVGFLLAADHIFACEPTFLADVLHATDHISSGLRWLSSWW